MVYGGNVKIGVLGGIGPEATGEFYLKLVRGLQQSGLIGCNKDFPQILVNSIPAPELVMDDISDEQLTSYKNGLKELDNFGVDFIVMVCNSIHLCLEQLQLGVRAPIIDLREKVRQKLVEKGAKKLAVLGVSSTISKGLYRFKEFEYIDLPEQLINELGPAIVKYNKGEEKDKQQQIIESISKDCLRRGADIILLACTEIAVMLKDDNLPKIDTLDVLAQSTVSEIIKLSGQD